MLTPSPGKKLARNAVIAGISSLALIGVWHLASVIVNAAIILPSPLKVLGVATVLFAAPAFQHAFGATLLRGIFAFAISMALAFPVGIASGRSSAAKAALAPVLTLVRSIPVLAVILLALIWFRADVVPVFSAVLMALPPAAAALEEGARSIDRDLMEMAIVYRVRPMKRVLGVALPGMLPFIAVSAQGALGLCWKVVIAGEVLSMPRWAIGTGMQSARVQLETAEVFAWAFAGVILCALTDLAFAVVRHSGRKSHAV